LLDCSHSGCQVLHLAAGIPELCHTGKTVVRANPQYQGLTLHQRIQIMSLDAFPITRRWPSRTPGAIQLYSLPTPNGVKVSIALEELALPHDAHLVNFATNDQLSEAFLSLNPNNKIPAVLDPGGPGGKPLPLFESGAILICLAGKTGQLLPQSNRCETLQWLMFRMAVSARCSASPAFSTASPGKWLKTRVPRNVAGPGQNAC
jgi:GST-like protein